MTSESDRQPPISFRPWPEVEDVLQHYSEGGWKMFGNKKDPTLNRNSCLNCLIMRGSGLFKDGQVETAKEAHARDMGDKK